jgi:hypothetical protein
VTWLFRLALFVNENDHFYDVNTMAKAACRGLKGADEAIQKVHVPEVQEPIWCTEACPL